MAASTAVAVRPTEDEEQINHKDMATEGEIKNGMNASQSSTNSAGSV